MQHSLTIVPDELLKMYKSNRLIFRSTEKNDRANMLTLLNMALGLNTVGTKFNQDFPL